jgi:hypothetical protein
VEVRKIKKKGEIKAKYIQVALFQGNFDKNGFFQEQN